MNNFTKETYQTKREILNFSKKITEGTFKPMQKLTQDIIYGILSSKSCLLSDISRELKEDIKLINTIDRLSNRLATIDKEEKEKMKENYYKEVMRYLPDEYVIVLNDDTDLNKEYSKKLEDLCVVRDASSQVERYVNGYKVCEYVALSKIKKTPMSLYSKIYSTTSDNFKSENDETIQGENEVIKILGKENKKPIFIRDRGYDANEYFEKDIKEDNKFVTRLKGNRYLLFKGKKRIVEDVAEMRKGKISTKLMYQGENKECSISYTKVELPACKGKEVSLVTIHGLSKDGVPMMLLTNLEVKDKESAEHIVRLYFLRWRIEEYFNVKKEYKWENSLLRTLESMNNLNMMLTMAMTHISILVEKLDKNFHSNVILERAKSLKEKAIIYLGMMGTGIKEILRYARCGIKEWQHIEEREKYKQLELRL